MQVLAEWDRCFPNCEPFGHRLRVAFPSRWVRFHSLPDSQRYPSSEDDFVELLARHNTILGELARPGSEVVLVTTGWSASPAPSRSQPQVVGLDGGAIPWRSLAIHTPEEEEDDPQYWHWFASGRLWKAGTFDPLVRLVAKDAVSDVLLVAPDCRWVLHPYDGGMDVIAPSEEARDALRSTYATWLSAREDGL